MKMGKLLKRKAEEWQSSGLGEHFLRYKALKQQLKHISEKREPGDDKDIGHAFKSTEDASTTLQTEHIPSPVSDDLEGPRNQQRGSIDEGALAQAASDALTPAELSFIDTLKEDLEQFNDFFIEKEEECIIRTQDLKEQLSRAEGDSRSLARLRSAFVDLHGEMVLLLHWSMLNYTAVVKILKKHDKQSGVVLRAPFLATVLKQPFYSTERITELVRDVEQHLSTLLVEESDADRKEGSAEGSPSGKSPSAPLLMRTQAALDMWQEMGSKASTPSTVLPAKRPKLEGAAAPDLAQAPTAAAALERGAAKPAEVAAK